MASSSHQASLSMKLSSYSWDSSKIGAGGQDWTEFMMEFSTMVRTIPGGNELETFLDEKLGRPRPQDTSTPGYLLNDPDLQLSELQRKLLAGGSCSSVQDATGTTDTTLGLDHATTSLVAGISNDPDCQLDERVKTIFWKQKAAVALVSPLFCAMAGDGSDSDYEDAEAAQAVAALQLQEGSSSSTQAFQTLKEASTVHALRGLVPAETSQPVLGYTATRMTTTQLLPASKKYSDLPEEAIKLDMKLYSTYLLSRSEGTSSWTHS